MYCHQCGKEVGDAKFCPYCGTQIDGTNMNQQGGYQPLNHQSYNQNVYARPDDESNFAFSILSFFIPIVGLILYLIWNKEYPLKAKSCLHGLIAGVVVYVVAFCCMLSVIGKLASEDYYDYYDGYYTTVVETVYDK